MRYIASSLLLAWFTISLSLPLHAAAAVVPPSPASSATTAPVGLAPETAAQQAFGVHEETPNQRRLRLGETIVASFPTPDYGEAIETPNQRRQRLGLPMPGADAFGVAEETPNARRARLATQTASLQ